METFDFPYHTQSTKYPVSGAQVDLGGSYTYTSEPVAPDARSFTLSLTGFKYFGETGNVNLTQRPQINMAVLDAFYQRHRLWKSFVYPHPVFGNVVCKFAKPLEIPKGIPGADGGLEGFTLELKEQP